MAGWYFYILTDEGVYCLYSSMFLLIIIVGNIVESGTLFLQVSIAGQPAGVESARAQIRVSCGFMQTVKNC